MATGLFTLKQVNQAISQGAWSGYIAPKWVEYLVVAGGGGASSGGAGAGGLLTGIVTVTAGTSYSVTVGGGGASGITNSSAGANGVASVFGSISATGGGGSPFADSAANSGGSGAGAPSTSTAYFAGGQGVSGQGNAGGSASSIASPYPASGGGGAGTRGLNGIGSSTSAVAGNGGAGIASAISGTTVVYAGGGGGGLFGSATPGVGGVGGGGSGGASGGGAGASGGANTGGGAGGGTGSTYAGGNGGSGIVVVRYPGNVQFYTGGTVTYSNGYIVHNFTANGTLAPTTPTVVSEYQISRSLRFNSADSAYLDRTPATATNRRTWTWSAWIKRSAIVNTSADWRLFESRPSGYTIFDITNSGATYPNSLRFLDDSGAIVQTTPLYRDVSAWYHIILAVDTTQATDSNRVKIYVNGVQVTSFTSSTYPTLNYQTQINTTNPQVIGRDPVGGGAGYYDGYMTEVNFVDGQALTPTSFGYVNPTTGIWSPAKFVGGYGTNGFYLNFSDNSNTTAATLGADYSGNGNNWTPNNFSVTAGAGNDSLVDSPTSFGTDTGVGGEVRGNYCTLNPLTTTAGTYTQGNLRYTGANQDRRSNATISRATGQWYWEVTLGNAPVSPRYGGSQYNCFGFGVSTSFNSATGPTSVTDALILGDSGYYKNFSGSWTDGGTAFSSGDVLSIAVDLDANTFTFRRNNTSLVTGTIGGTAGRELVPIIISYNGDYGVMDCNFGQRPFAYTSPSGFKALCTQNLPTPTIGATTATLATQYFNPVTFSGTGTTNAITVGFAPDFAWLKSRSAASGHNLHDIIRGNSKVLYSNSTSAEDNYTNICVFNSNGVSLANTSDANANGTTNVGWFWKANGSGTTNTSGSITSTVSANTTSGFSVVTYTGTGANATVGHGLGVAPSMIIGKARNSALAWRVYHTSIGAANFLALNTTDASASGATWNSTTPTSTVFTVGGGSNMNVDSSTTYVAYCFAPIAGYSAFGSFTGNGSADGAFVFTGMRPAFVMLKASSTGGAGYNWGIFDNDRLGYNSAQRDLRANTTDTEGTDNNLIDFLSNGFKIRSTSGGFGGGSGVTYIYMAFAENPFKYSLAR